MNDYEYYLSGAIKLREETKEKLFTDNIVIIDYVTGEVCIPDSGILRRDIKTAKKIIKRLVDWAKYSDSPIIIGAKCKNPAVKNILDEYLEKVKRNEVS